MGDRIMGGAIKQEGHLVAVEICTGGYLEIYCSSIFYGIELYKFIEREESKRGGEFRGLCSILFDQYTKHLFCFYKQLLLVFLENLFKIMVGLEILS